MLKGRLQSPQLKDHVHTIGINQPLSNNAIYENKFLKNIKKLYKQAGKCKYQKTLIDILEDAIVSTPKGITDNSYISPRTPTPVKKPSAQKSLCMFTKKIEKIKKLLTVELELLNLSARQLKLEIHYGH